MRTAVCLRLVFLFIYYQNEEHGHSLSILFCSKVTRCMLDEQFNWIVLLYLKLNYVRFAQC